jgi:predicted ribosome quality control (RQC) complex YloA/Tae2 family protein
MSTEAEELLGELVKKIEGLEIKILAISNENKELTRVVQLIYEQNYKLVKENKESIRKTDSQSEKDVERETA